MDCLGGPGARRSSRDHSEGTHGNAGTVAGSQWANGRTAAETARAGAKAKRTRKLTVMDSMTPQPDPQGPTEERPFRVLALDGGGSKGVYTLGVLKEVEAIANAPLCTVFDLVFGTSTGAIIAALIALGKSIADIETLYFTLIPNVMTRRFSRG